MGSILLAGGAEFGGHMASVDHAAIAAAGGYQAPISIVPAAAAPDNNHKRAGQNGVKWFRSLGATRVEAVHLIDQASANDPEIIAKLQQSRLIYLLGGFPRYLAQTLAASKAWQAIDEAMATDLVLGGSSAGAMVLCDKVFDPSTQKTFDGLHLLNRACVVPHHDTFGQTWLTSLRQQLPHHVLIGIDEETAMLQRDREWHVYGKGRVTLYRGRQVLAFGNGHRFRLDA